MVAECRVLGTQGADVSPAASHATGKRRALKPKPPGPPAVAATVAQDTNVSMHRRNFSQKAKEESSSRR